MNYENAYKLLEEKGQLHLLKYYDTLSEAEQAALLNQISEIDFSLIDMIGHNSSGSDSDIAPVAALQMDSIAEKYDIKVIMLITPETSEERIRLIDEHTDLSLIHISEPTRH